MIYIGYCTQILVIFVLGFIAWGESKRIRYAKIRSVESKAMLKILTDSQENLNKLQGLLDTHHTLEVRIRGLEAHLGLTCAGICDDGYPLYTAQPVQEER